MRYKNTLTGIEFTADSEISAPHIVKIEEPVSKEEAPKPKKATTKKGAKK